MQYMILWSIPASNMQAAIQAFGDRPVEALETEGGDQVRIVGRWHDMVGRRGVAICESDDLEAVHLWALQWNSICDLEVVPVVGDVAAHGTANKAMAQA